MKSEVERQRELRSIISSGESLVRRGRSWSFLSRSRMWLRQSAMGTEGKRRELIFNHCMWRDSSVGRVLNFKEAISSLQSFRFDSRYCTFFLFGQEFQLEV